LKEIELHILIYFHNSGFITTSVAVVRGRENCDDIAFVSPVIAVHH
jgi:hypothetical protein